MSAPVMVLTPATPIETSPGRNVLTSSDVLLEETLNPLPTNEDLDHTHLQPSSVATATQMSHHHKHRHHHHRNEVVDSRTSITTPLAFVIPRIPLHQILSHPNNRPPPMMSLKKAVSIPYNLRISTLKEEVEENIIKITPMSMPTDKDRPSPFADLRKQHLKNLTLDQLYERLDTIEDDERREIDEVIAKFQREKEALLSGSGGGIGRVVDGLSRGESRRGSNS
ncbi:UNVERIFIED_CONTAM: hypothetical protein HDU68_012862 [Siphonaria sp. JEL0065]|nr:hypothetical protein HDU68_012862 [Siphonaria sp. JEL0065]